MVSFGSSGFDAVPGTSFEGSEALGASGVFSSLTGLAANFVTQERLSSSSARIAIVLPTATFFEPSWAYDVDARTPRYERHNRNVTYNNLCENAILLCLKVNDCFCQFPARMHH